MGSDEKEVIYIAYQALNVTEKQVSTFPGCKTFLPVQYATGKIFYTRHFFKPGKFDIL